MEIPASWNRCVKALAIACATLLLPVSPVFGAATCPLATATPTKSETPAPIVLNDPACLVKVALVSADSPIYDVRSRSEYQQLHIPGAINSGVTEVAYLLRSNTKPVVIYDGGKFGSDAFLLCGRLRNAGAKNFKILEGGIAQWSQSNRHPDRLEASRLSDVDVAALLIDSKTTAISSAGNIRSLFSEHGIRQGPPQAAGRRVLIADPATPNEKISAFLDGKGPTAFYWKGDAGQLLTLVHTHLAQHQKRASGPAQSATCSAL